MRPAATATPRPLPPVSLPRDEGPHDVLAEWWYYTGHLYPTNAPDRELGFEFVFFRGVRGERPPGYAAHFAVTDVMRGRFAYDQRQDVALREAARPTAASRGPGIVAAARESGGFDMQLGDWSMRGANGSDSLQSALPGYALDLSLTALKPPALHLGAPPLEPGLISFGPAGYSYYYSRTRMAAAGALVVDGARLEVRGEAWMDHQWGDFLVLGGGGWDWFAVNLADGRDVTASVIRDESGAVVIAYGTLVDAAGNAQHLAPGSFAIQGRGRWTSPRTGIAYPAGWSLRVPGVGLDLILQPLLPDQELDTRASTGVIYWEGAVAVADATGTEVGRGYVELTGYK
ncbi:MAG TPA: lipocalin family protein [Chloroflexota bacterium]|nr:lipocalin family protein [Chloroflexota bacterium]